MKGRSGNRFIKNTLQRIVVFIFCFLFSSYSFAQGISFKATLDSTKIIIGDQVRLTLTAKYSKGYQVFFPDLKDTLTDKVEVIENLGIDTIKAENGYLVLRQKYLISCFDSGYYRIPPIKLVFKNNSKEDSLFSNELALEVFTVPIDTTKQAICDIKEQIDTPFTFKEFFQRFYPVMLAILILVLLGFAGWYLYKKLKRKEPIIKKISKPKEPAHIIAYRELERIKSEKLWQKNMVKDYHSQLTEAIRIYIENRYNISAMEQTTEEIMQSFTNSVFIDGKCVEILQHMLILADLVKFAKAEPLPDENDLSLKNAFYFIDNTMMRITKDEDPKQDEENIKM